MKRFLTVEEVADMFGVHPVTVRRWIEAGHIQAVRPGRRAFRIPAAEVDRLSALTVKPAEHKETPDRVAA